MSILKEHVIDFVRKTNAHDKARAYHDKKQKEMVESRERLMKLMNRGGPPRIMVIDNYWVVVEFGNNGISVRKGELA